VALQIEAGISLVFPTAECLKLPIADAAKARLMLCSQRLPGVSSARE
jgi:hypothetical protein